MRKRWNIVKLFALAGCVASEFYMFYAVTAPRQDGGLIPLEAILIRLAAASVFFGAFGLAAGTGVGLLVQGVADTRTKSSKANDQDPTKG